MSDEILRRTLLTRLAGGFGTLAFSAFATTDALAQAAAKATNRQANPLAPKAPHFPAKAKHVIWLCMRGAPSHVDTFDYKPELEERNGMPGPGRLGRGAKLLKSKWAFEPSGDSGLWISSLFPELRKHADKMCLIRSMHTDQPSHPQAFVQMHTGSFQFVRPSVGAWTLYGLGTVNQNLPGFLSIKPPAGNGGAQNYGSAFLPAIYQGTPIGKGNQPIASSKADYIASPLLKPESQRQQLDFIQKLHAEALATTPHLEQVNAAITSYELAFRMQADLPTVMNLDSEPVAIQSSYGIGTTVSDDFGRQCLMARRAVEAGVRFVEVTPNVNWDQHANLANDLPRNCAAVDKPIAGLLADLAARGLLDSTLVVWAGEFGRTPTAQNGDGRDHNNKGFTVWMAGGGVRGGLSFGGTDPLGFEAVDHPVHVHDLHATVLQLLGLDHTRLTYRYAGRDFRLTDVKGNVVKEVITV